MGASMRSGCAASASEMAIKEVRDSIGAVGTKSSSRDFETKSESHKRAALYWLIASVITISGLARLSYFLFHDTQFSLSGVSGDDIGKIIQIGLFKIVALSVGYFIVYQCIKSYKINKHLEVLNKHRQLALDIYPFMTAAAGSPEQSHVILGQAAKAIFEQGTTGYLDGDDSPSPVNLTGIVNRIIDKEIK
jgi:hypothetical protein